jgi:hypothetical protein
MAKKQLNDHSTAESATPDFNYSTKKLSIPDSGLSLGRKMFTSTFPEWEDIEFASTSSERVQSFQCPG